MKSYGFKYPSEPASESLMLDDLSDLLEKLELDGEMKHKIMLVVSEAFTNAYLHGNRENPALAIKIGLTLNETEILVDISDEGEESEGLKNIENKEPAGLLEENGRGIDLMKYYADDVRFERGEKGGLKVITVFSREKKNEVKI